MVFLYGFGDKFFFGGGFFQFLHQSFPAIAFRCLEKIGFLLRNFIHSHVLAFITIFGYFSPEDPAAPAAPALSGKEIFIT